MTSVCYTSKHMRIARQILLLFLALGVVLSAKAIAATPNLSNSYKSTSTITAGSLVSLDKTHSGYIVLANNQTNTDLIGVAVKSNQSLLAVNSGSGNVQVALNGVANALVSTLNGNISVGDQVGVSPINGVGMKAEAGSRVIGNAQESFNSGSAGASTTQVTSKSGQTSTISIGFIPVVISISTAPSAKGSGTSVNVIQRTANAIAGHSVSLLPLIISSIIAVLSLVSVVVLIYGTINGSLISIGRNPLAKPAIFESLAQVFGMITLIIIIALIAIYLILR